MKYLIRTAFLLLITITLATAQSIIPAPNSIVLQQAEPFQLTSSTIIKVSNDDQSKWLGKYFNDRIASATGWRISVGGTNNVSVIELQIDKTSMDNPEGYILEVSSKKVLLKANTHAGLFYGIQTLLQLLPPEIEALTTQKGKSWTIPSCVIKDYPRFKWRGVMLDVSRHFFPKEYVKEYIDQIARYKFNRLHLHLTDDHGWRIEIKSLPKLTSIGAWRVPRQGTFGTFELPKAGEAATDGGYFTHEDIKEIVQYAKERYIEIMPEIDVPGHSMAAIAAYPELCVTKDPTIKVNPGTAFSKWYGGGKFEMFIDNTLNPTDEKVYDFLDKVFTEVASLFPFEYIHMGGDECYRGYWEKDQNVQVFMKKNNMETSAELQTYFNNRVAKIIQSKNKKVIGWDEILEGGIIEDAAIMSWRGIKTGIEATHKKHHVVISPNPQYYLDMVQGEPSIEPQVYNKARLKDAYMFDVLPKEMDSTFVLGGQGNLWTEKVPTPMQVEYMTYPRAFAISETFWSPKGKKNFTSFVNRVEDHFVRFDHAEINYAPSIFDPIVEVKKNVEGNMVMTLTSEAPNVDIYYTLDNTIPSYHHSKYEKPIVLPRGISMVRIITYRGKNQKGRLITLPIEEIAKRVTK